MKKHAFWIYLGRCLIAVLCIVIISLVGIFAFDKYPTVKAEYSEQDDYWVKLEGFKSYDDLKAEENKYNINSTEYESPFYDENGKELSLYDKIYAARYKEELDNVVKTIKDRITELETQKKKYTKLYEGSKNDWFLDVLSAAYIYTKASSLYESVIELGYKGSESELENLVLNYQNVDVYQQLQADGYTGEFSRFVIALSKASGTGSESLYEKAVENGYVPTSTNEEEARKAWTIEVAGLTKAESTSAFDFIVSNGYKGTADDWFSLVNEMDGLLFYNLTENGFADYRGSANNDYNFYKALYNDTGKFKSGVQIIKGAYENATTLNEEKMNIINQELNELNELNSIANSRNLGTWTEYASRYQKLLENDDYIFEMNLVLTTFRVTDKRTNYVWYSNPATIDSTTLKNSQNTIISVYYGETGGALNEFSNYKYSTSTEENGSTVKPNFAIKVDEKTNTIQVFYHMEKRSIDYTSIPKYFSVERMEEMLENNKEIASLNQTDSNGDKILDLEECLKYDIDSLTAKKTEIETSLKGSLTAEEKKTLEENLELVTTQIEDYNSARTIWGQIFDSWFNKKNGSNPNSLKEYDYYEYVSTKYEFMSNIILKACYRYFYEWFGYDTGKLADDNSEFDQEIDLDRVAFEIGIQYELTDSGLKVTVPGGSIREIGDHTLCNIDILPYFTSTPSGVEGYTLIPDGSGSILEHDNGKANNYEPYIKRFYTTDLSQLEDVKPAESEDIMLPMYAVVNTSSAILVDIQTMAAQLELRATTSGYGSAGESNNKNYLRAYIRESQDVFIGTYSKEAVRKFTDKRLTEDIVISYIMLGNSDGTSYTYSDIANIYRNILIERYDIEMKDTTKSPVLDMNVIGAYTYKDNFAGISYKAKGTMTTYSELNEILETYSDLGFNYINVFYKGWRKEALVNTTFKKLQLNKLLGSKKQLKQLVEDNENVTIYPYVSFGQVNKYQESFGLNHYTVRDVIGEIIYSADYDLNTGTFGKGQIISTVSPHYYQAFAQSLVDSYVKLFGTEAAEKNNIGINSISIDKFGSALSGDYKKNNEMFKFSAIKEQLKSLEIISEKIDNINLYKPYDYAFKYITHASDIPYQSSRKELLDYSVPFYQLVVNGMFDYSGESINEHIESGEQYHLMKLIETGSNPQFTFTYDSSKELIQTDYNNYYNTQYTNWIDTVQTIYTQLTELGIYKYRLVAHERIEPNVYMVTYGNGTDKIQIVLNYSFASINYNGVNIPAKSYKTI